MIYRQLFEKFGNQGPVRAGVIGTGHFATAIVTQSQAMAALEVPVVCDLNVDAARQAYRRAGLDEADFVVCESHSAALATLEKGKRVILPDGDLMMDLPLDIIVESTGVPAASARHGAEAIRHGKHVAMVSKEVDVTIGPILKHRADQAGVIYTAVDGDQHGLLIALVQWARDLGLTILSGGKALDGELVFDEAAGTVDHPRHSIALAPADQKYFQAGPPVETIAYLAKRRELLGDVGRVAGYDVVEMVIAANATGLQPDIETLHGPPLRTPEIPEALAPINDGGILTQPGIIETVTCLRDPYEAGLGGGVFIVVRCDNDYSRHILVTKGLISNSRGTTALIYRPYHLCGVETPMSLLVAALLRLPTGATEYLPRYDVIARAADDLQAGDPAGSDHSRSLQALVRLAQPATGGQPIPLHLANGNRLKVDVPAGTILTVEMVEAPTDSVLWALRAEQDRYFLLNNQ